MFNIDTFKSVLNQHGGPLRSNKFRIRFLPPPALNNNGQFFEHLEYFAEQATLPGVNLSSHDVRRYGYGPIEKRVIGHTFTDFNISFMGDGHGDVHRIMYQWLESISSFDARLGGDLGGNFSGPNQTVLPPYLIRYKNEYVTDLHVQMFSEESEGDQDESTGEYKNVQPKAPVIDLVLREAFPMSIADSQLSWADLNNNAKFTVQFAYVDWHLERSSVSNLR